jgi:hypothetical protein
MGKLIAVTAAVAAKLTLIDSATISRKLCNSLMVDSKNKLFTRFL